MQKNKITNYDKFPTTNKTINEGDIWLAKFPYKELGNMEKLRPVYIDEILTDKVKVIMITSNKQKGIEINIKSNKNKKSYLTNRYAYITTDKIYRKIGDLKIYK